MTMINAAEREEILALGVTRSFPPGRNLLVQGRRDSHIEIIREGFAKVTSLAGGLPRLLGVLLPGDLAGELAAMTGNARTATVTASGAVVSTVVRQSEFLKFLGAHPQVAIQVAATVGQRLNWSNTRRSDFTAFPIHVRLARILRDLTARCGRPVEDGILLTIELSQSDLASLVGAGEDTVQRALRMLRRQGLIRTGYRQLVLLDGPGLQKLIEDVEWH